MGGQIDLMFDQASNALPQVRGGTVKAFAVMAKTRLPNAPDIPTTDEAGLPVSMRRCGRACGPRRARPRKRSRASMRRWLIALADPAVAQRLRDIGQEPFGPEQRRRRTRWRHSRRPKPTNGGRSSGPANLKGE